MYILALKGRSRRDTGAPGRPLQPEDPPTDTRTVPAGRYRIGTEKRHTPYDNEHPAFLVQLDEFHICRHPVSNAEYLKFIQEGGYRTAEYWSDEGWQWRTGNAVNMPHNWQYGDNGHPYVTDEYGSHPLQANAPLSGISYHEAAAFARWAGARLPHEYEWEAAKKLLLLDGDGTSWEWCGNPFHPYKGFTAYPYAGYSTPWFDGRHFTLRGGSRYTLSAIRRDTFRNYYQARTRHIHAGLRLVFP